MAKIHTQLNLFDDSSVLNELGFTVSKAFESNGLSKFVQLENTYNISLEGKSVLYLQDNQDGTFNTFGFFHSRFRISMQEVIEGVKNKGNWCIDNEALEYTE